MTQLLCRQPEKPAQKKQKKKYKPKTKQKTSLEQISKYSKFIGYKVNIWGNYFNIYQQWAIGIRS